MRTELLAIWIIGFLLSSCTSSEVVEGEFSSVYKRAQLENKYLWMLIGGGETCKPCERMVEVLKKNGILRKYRNRYLFYKCNAADSVNRFVNHIFLTEYIPNLYIFNPQGKLVSWYAGEMEGKKLRKYLSAALEQKPMLEQTHSQFHSTSLQLLKMQNFLLQGNLLYLEAGNDQVKLQHALSLIQQSIDIEACFYNLYLETLILYRLEKKQQADSSKQETLKYYKSGFQGLVYEPLVHHLKEIGSQDTVANTSAAKIEFHSREIECGEIEYDACKNYEFTFHNRGEQPLILSYVSSTCGCITLDWNSKPVPNGEEGKIAVRFHADRKGKFSRTIFVQSNDPEGIVKLVLKGYIK